MVSFVFHCFDFLIIPFLGTQGYMYQLVYSPHRWTCIEVRLVIIVFRGSSQLFVLDTFVIFESKGGKILWYQGLTNCKP